MTKPHLLAALCSLAAVCFGCPGLRADDAAAAGKDKPRSCTPAQKNPDRHEQFMKDKAELKKKGEVQLVFIGDSITDSWRHGAQNKLFNDRWGKYNPYNIGISGDETQHVLWRIEHGELDDIKPKLAVMMIGTNNMGNSGQSPEETAAGIHCLVKAVREKLPDTKILLLGVFPRGQGASDPFRAKIKTVNDTIAKLDDGGKTVRYMDIGPKFLSPSGDLPADVMPDALHPNEKGYEIWADAISPVIEEMMK